MLWISGSILLVIWAVLKFALHKSGMVHVILFAALTVFVIQLAQEWRTREYRRDMRQ